MDFQFEPRKDLKEKPQGPLGFGKYYTDYMFVADYDADQGGWHDARIVPFGPIEMDPASMVLHYAQETFEGLKAYRTKDGGVELASERFQGSLEEFRKATEQSYANYPRVKRSYELLLEEIKVWFDLSDSARHQTFDI